MAVKKDPNKKATKVEAVLTVTTYNPRGLAGAILKVCERYKVEDTTVGLLKKR